MELEILEILKELFSAHLTPIQKDIKELKDGQSQLIEIAKIQAKHDIEIMDIKKDVDDCAEKVENIKETKNNRLWEVTKLGIAGFIGAIIAKFF